jgi:hypothetical protein
MKKNCLICDAEFEAKQSRARFCSRVCIVKNRRKDWTKTCEVCSAVYKNKAHNSKSCSKTCAKIRAKAVRPKSPSKMQPAIKRICECGKEFEAVGLGRNRMSCSKECADKRRKEQIKEHHHKNKVLMVRTCEFCPTTFNPTASQRICLSDECKKKLQKEYNKKYYKTPPAEQQRAYRNKHRDRINEYFREYNAKRRKIPKHAVSGRMYAAIRKVIKKRKMGVSTTKTLNDLYTEEEIMSHLESYFTEENGYTWDNMSEWHIDHIRPVSSFNYTTTECEDFKKCWALNNLQPLWAKDNLRKGDKWDGVVNA